MIVVGDSSPITNLAAIGQFDLLRRQFEELLIPEAVWDELGASGKQWPGREEVRAAAWVRKIALRDRALPTALVGGGLGPGEAETIALALEVAATLVFLDERAGRHQAQRLGLRVTGVCGVLVRAKERGDIALVKPRLDDLRARAGFWLADAIYRETLELAGEA